MPHRTAPAAPQPRDRKDERCGRHIEGDRRDGGAADPGGFPADQRREHGSRPGCGARQREEVGEFAVAGPALHLDRLLRDICDDRIAAAEPAVPRRCWPICTVSLVPLEPGKAWPTVSICKNAVSSIQCRCSTMSRCSQPAVPPPKLVQPSRRNVRKIAVRLGPAPGVAFFETSCV